ncbi:MAG: ABC transporter ATP-binding protein [Desulfovibrio sp.]
MTLSGEPFSGDDAVVYRLLDVCKLREKGGVSFELRIPEFTVRRGEFIAVVGPSGCGKSTLLDMLGLVLKPSEAREFAFRCGGENELVSLAGLKERRLAEVRRSCIGYVLQSGGLLPFLSVRENILLPCRLNDQRGAETVAALAARLGIADQLGKKPQHLSGGQRQRVAIARALAHRPPFVLADEPTAAVDKLTAEEIQKQFKEISRQLGVTLVLVTHDLGLARSGADRIFSFRIRRDGPERTVSTLVEKGVTAGERATGRCA